METAHNRRQNLPSDASKPEQIQTKTKIQIQIQIQTEIQIQIQIQTEIQIQMQTESILDASKPKHQLTFEFCFVSDKYFFPSWHQRCYITKSH